MNRNNGISSTHQACAACKHQRKRCTDKCILAPFFPAEKVREFQAVHKVFGVSNVQKMVRNLVSDEDRKRAADSLVWEALCRQKDPVLGPYGEYRKINDELKSYQSQGQSQMLHHQLNPFVTQNRLNNGSGHKSGNELIGWSINTNGSGGISSKMNYSGMSDNVALVDCIRAQCGPVLGSGLGSGLYGNCGSHEDLHGVEKMRHNLDANVGSILHPQQHIMNGFNQHYYLPGQISSMDAKPIEGSLWEAES